MGFFYQYVAQAMSQINPVAKTLEAGKLSPYTAIVLFSAGLLLSSFLWNSIMMVKPFAGAPVPFGPTISPRATPGFSSSASWRDDLEPLETRRCNNPVTQRPWRANEETNHNNPMKNRQTTNNKVRMKITKTINLLLACLASACFSGS